MTSPLQRAARALFAQEVGAGHFSEAEFQEHRDYWLASARAAILAIRESTPEMLDRGGFICSPCSDNAVRWKVLNKAERNFSQDYAEEVYQAMIDAALSD